MDVRDPELMSVGTDEVVVTFVTDPGVEVTTEVGESSATTKGPFHVAHIKGLEPDCEYPLTVERVAMSSEYLPPTVRTLQNPGGRLLATFATANDVHF